MDLDALQDFTLVVAHGGLGAASRAAKRSKATLSRRVATLERQLGVRLIERGDRGMRLTEEGRLLHERASGPLAELAAAGMAAISDTTTPRGILRISAPVLLAHVALMPIILRYSAAHKQVQVDVVAEDRRVDPVEDGFDVVLRVNPSPDERLVGRRVMKDERWVVATPSLAAPAGGGETQQVRAVMMTTAESGATWRLRRPGGAATVLVPEPVMRLSSLLMVREAVIGGAGVGLLPKLLVAQDVAAGQLACWGVLDVPAVEVWALHSSRRLTSAKVRLFLELLETIAS